MLVTELWLMDGESSMILKALSALPKKVNKYVDQCTKNIHLASSLSVLPLDVFLWASNLGAIETSFVSFFLASPLALLLHRWLLSQGAVFLRYLLQVESDSGSFKCLS